MMFFHIDDPTLLWAVVATLLLPATYYLLLLHYRHNTIEALERRLKDVSISKRFLMEARRRVILTQKPSRCK